MGAGDRTRVHQDKQLQASETYDDTLPAGATLETQTSGQGDLNALRSQARRFGQLAGYVPDWHSDPNGGFSFDAQADEAVVPGAFVYTKANGAIALADSTALPQARVSGVSMTTTAIGFSATALTGGRVELADWTAILGAASLTPGTIYYLGASPGAITATAPMSGFLVRLGKAHTSTVLAVEISRPIKRAA